MDGFGSFAVDALDFHQDLSLGKQKAFRAEARHGTYGFLCGLFQHNFKRVKYNFSI